MATVPATVACRREGGYFEAPSPNGVLMRRAELVIASIAASVVVVYGVRLHAFFMGPDAGPVGFDEGYIAAIGERLIDGRWLPYVDGASHRGPLLYWATAVFELGFGRFSWNALRALSALSCVVTLLALFALGVVARRPLAGAVAALVHGYFLLFVLQPGTGIALNGETLAAPLSVLALLATAIGLSRRSASIEHLAVGGAFACAAMLAKQTALLVLVPLWLWVIAVVRSDQLLERSARRWRIAAPGLGFAVPLGLVLGRYAAAGELGTFFYWFYGYNVEIYMRPYAEQSTNAVVTDWITRESLPVIAVVLVLVWSLAKALAPLARLGRGRAAALYAEEGLEVTVALGALVTLVSALAPLRFWGHYFVVVSPWFALLVGLRGHDAVLADHPRVQLVRHALVALGLGGFVGWALDARLRGLDADRAAGLWPPPTPEPLCDAVHRWAPSESDPIFVWGFDGDLYVTCRRPPASRYTYTTLVAGIVPPYWHRRDDALVARDAVPTLARELDAVSPRVVLDIPAKLAGHGIASAPAVEAVLRARYCRQPVVAGRGFRVATPWVLKGAEACPELPPEDATAKPASPFPFRLELFAPRADSPKPEEEKP